MYGEKSISIDLKYHAIDNNHSNRGNTEGNLLDKDDYFSLKKKWKQYNQSHDNQNIYFVLYTKLFCNKK